MVETYALELGIAAVVGVSLVVAVAVCAPLRRRPCRWRRLRARDRAAMQAWRCRRCGEDAYSMDRRAPKECKRALRRPL